MKLIVSDFKFLASGAVSVEVCGEGQGNPPITTAIDNVRFRIYVPKEEIPNEIGALKEMAIKAAQVSISRYNA